MAGQSAFKLPREGFTFNVIDAVIRSICLNPILTGLLLALSLQQGSTPPWTVSLSLAFLVGVMNWLGGYLDDGVENNWTTDSYHWSHELVVITGGSSGIGAAIVSELTEHQIKTINIDIQPPAEEDKNQLSHFYKCDLSSESDITATCDAIRDAHGNPTVLINNAGFWNKAPLLRTTNDASRRLFSVNTLAPLQLLRVFLPSMLAKNHGMIVTMSSVAAYGISPAGMVDYSASKAANVAVHEGLSAELVARYDANKVRTVLVVPYFVKTPMAKGLVHNMPFVSPVMDPATVGEAVVEKILRGRSGTLILPQSNSYFLMLLRAFPAWLHRSVLISPMVANSTAKVDGSN